MSRRDSDRQDAVRLGGQQARDAGTADALSIEVLAEHQEFPQYAPPPIAEWQALLENIGFDAEQRAYAIARIEGVSLEEMPDHLGMTALEVDALRKRVERALKALRTRQPSIEEYWARFDAAPNRAIWEQLPSGRHVWTIKTPEPFPSKVVSFEYLQRQCPKRQFSGGIFEAPLVLRGDGMESLETQLSTARGTEARMWARKVANEEALGRAESALDAAVSALHADQVRAELEDGAVSSKLIKQVTEAKAAVTAAIEKAAITERAYREANKAVLSIENDVAAGKFERFKAAAEAPGKRLRKAMDEFIAASVEAYEVSRQYGFLTRGEVMFPDELDNFSSSATLRNYRISLQNEALRLADVTARSWGLRAG